MIRQNDLSHTFIDIGIFKITFLNHLLHIFMNNVIRFFR